MSETKDESVSSPAPHARDRSPSITSASDRETDTFEDAPDTASIRSLTKRTPSVSRKSPPADSGTSELEQAFQKVRRNRPTPAGHDGTVTDNKDGETPDANSEADGHHGKVSAIPDGSITISNDLDNVNLDDDSAPADTPAKDTPATESPPPPVPDKESSYKTLSLGSLSNVLPWSPSSDSPNKPLPIAPAIPPIGAPPPQLTRKLTSPFAWLSRGSAQKEAAVVSPPVVSPRRNTASSVATLMSNPEMMLSTLEEEGNPRRGSGRNSLKDRFKMIRMREEAGITALPGSEDKEAGEGEADEGDGGSMQIKTRLSLPAGDEQPPLSPIPSPNPDLAPGTVSGVAAGPSSLSSASVDWDLWQAVIYEGPAAVARSSPEELNKAIATGIPNAVRGVIWQVLAQSKNEELEVVYHELVARGTDRDKVRHSNGSASHRDTLSSAASSVHSGESGSVTGATTATTTAASATASVSSVPGIDKAVETAAERKKKAKEDAAALSKLEKAIRRDIGARTSYSKFAAAQGLQEGLFGVCKAYALFDEPVGYAQGMNFLIMPLLFNMPEEEAFCLLVRLMNQYHLRELFVQDMPGLHKHLYFFERLLEDLEPALYCHLHRRGISSHLYATQWFLTLFAYRFPLQLVLRIYDLILSEGLPAILKFGVVLMQKNAAALLGMSDMSQLTTFLKDRLFDVYIDASPSAGSILENGFFGSSSSSLDKEVYRADQFVRDACEVKLTPELVKMYTTEWEEKTRTEKEREAELEHLRSSNANFAIKVRRLEERLQAVDGEQAVLATELVHTKVQNEELQDENESLKGQVRELKVVIEKQPEELEQAWQAERDDLMMRNAKVHEENQRVEKEMAELEEQLVQTKMQYAEINSQHEELSRKWAEMKRQFL